MQDDIRNYARGKLKEMTNRVLGSFYDYEMSYEQFVECAYPPELRDIALNHQKIFQTHHGAGGFWMTSVMADHGEMIIGVSIQPSNYAPLMPLRLAKPYDPTPLVAFANAARAVVGPLQDAWGVFTYLSERCRTPAQAAFFWPSYKLLLEGYGVDGVDYYKREKRWLKQVEEAREGHTPVQLPSIPKIVREKMPAAAAIITGASLMPEPKSRKVVLTLPTAPGQ